jgi:hypothetical protein
VGLGTEVRQPAVRMTQACRHPHKRQGCVLEENNFSLGDLRRIVARACRRAHMGTAALMCLAAAYVLAAGASVRLLTLPLSPFSRKCLDRLLMAKKFARAAQLVP